MASRRSNGQGTLVRSSPTAPWTAVWTENGKRVKRSTRTTDRRAAERILAKWMADLALKRAGVVDPKQASITKAATAPIEGHFEAFERTMKTAQRADYHISSTMLYLRSFGWTTLADVTADSANLAAGKLSDDGMSARTIQAYLTAAKSFTHWLVKNHKLPSDPLVGVTKPSPNNDPRRSRRMLLPDEWPWLWEAALKGEPWKGMAGPERALLYAVAIQTGLRSSELRSLSPGDFNLSVKPPYVLCSSEYTKNGQLARQYITTELAESLRQHIESCTGAVFAMPAKEDIAEMLRFDLAAARTAWLLNAPDRANSDFLLERNRDGEHLDFHALRHTCGAWLAMSGAHPKTIQTIMRHSTITLTMDTYGHLFPGQEADAINALSKLMPVSKSVSVPAPPNDA